MPSSSMDRPTSAGAISKTSRSPVARENPYTMVTTNPPMQSNRTSSWAVESSSRRNESHGSGMPLWGRVGKVFSLHVSEQIPVCSDTRPVFAQPLSFNLCHRVVAERILTRKASTFQNLQTLPKFSGPLAVVFALCDLTRKRHGKPQSVLPVTYFNVSDQPLPIHVSVRQCQPRQALGNSGVKVRLVQRVKQDSGRVLLNLCSEVRKPWITQRRQVFSEIVLP